MSKWSSDKSLTHARKVHAQEVHTHELYVPETHTYGVYAHGMHAHRYTPMRHTPMRHMHEICAYEIRDAGNLIIRVKWPPNLAGFAALCSHHPR
jgi:hypothetical protein